MKIVLDYFPKFFHFVLATRKIIGKDSHVIGKTGRNSYPSFSMSGVRRILATSFSRLLLGGVVIAAIGTALFATGLIKKKSNPNEIVRKGLVVNAEQLDLGDIYYTDSIEHTFTVSNPTSKPIEIEKWSTSCNCSVVEPQQLTVPANGSAEVKGKIFLPAALKDTNFKEPKAFGVLYMPQVKGAKEGNMRMEDGWAVQSRVLPVLIGQSTISLGRHSVLAQPIKPKVFEWKLGPGIEVKSVTSMADSVKAKLLPSEDGKCKIQLTPAESLMTSQLSSPIIFNCISLTTNLYMSQQLFCTFEIVDDIEVLPPSLICNNDEIMLTLYSLTNSTIGISKIEGRSIKSIQRSRLGNNIQISLFNNPVEYNCCKIIFTTIDGNDSVNSIQSYVIRVKQ